MRGIIGETIRGTISQEVIFSNRSHYLINVGRITRENVGEKDQRFVSGVANQVILGTRVLI